MFVHPRDSEGSKSLAKVKHHTEKLTQLPSLVVELPLQPTRELSRRTSEK